MPELDPLPAQIEIAHLTELLMDAPAFICALEGPYHRFELANEKYFELVGRRDLLRRTMEEALPELATQGCMTLLSQVYESGEAISALEKPLMLARGQRGALEERFVSYIYQPLRDEGGAIRGVFIHGVDVTEQVRSREAMLESERQLRLMADSMPQIVWMTRPDGFHEYYNRRWYEFIGATPEESEGEGWGNPLHPDDEARARARWAQSLQSGEPYEIEYRFRRFDGQYRWFLARALAVRADDGTILKWFGTCTDIEERRQTEQALQTANRLKDEFLATLSHELRTPLNAILGWASLLSEGGMDEETTQQGLETIERCARAQARLIEDLLDVSRILSGKMRLQMQPVGLNECVKSVLDTMRPAALVKEISLKSELESGAQIVEGDADRITQIAWNLLSNAIKFTPAGGQVSVSVARRDTWLDLSVSDNGQGIETGFLPFVFDRFRQADASTTRREGGLGIGLGLVRHLMELHGGAAQVESAGLGLGSVFTVSFPLAGSVSTQNIDAKSEAIDLSGLRILLVDDDADMRLVASRALEKQGAEVENAASAAEALKKIENCAPEAPFHLLVSDIGMPGESGHDLIGQVRRREGSGKNGFLAAIALTAYARTQDRDQSLLAGFGAHLVKPISPHELIDSAAKLTGRLNG